MVTAREDIARWRDDLLGGLTRAGTREAVASVAQLVAQEPSRDIGWSLAAAIETHRQNGWLPIGHRAIRRIYDDFRSRLVRTEDELLDVVLEQLAQIQEWLSGETPQAFALWDEGAPRRPKDESRISDWYAHSLRTCLEGRRVVADREVEVRNDWGSGVGNRQDIRLSAFAEGSRDPIVVVIEVKCAWNSGVRRALRTQLGDEYLIRGGLTHGIFLVVNTARDLVDDSRLAHRIPASTDRLQALLTKQSIEYGGRLRIAPVMHRIDLPRGKVVGVSSVNSLRKI